MPRNRSWVISAARARTLSGDKLRAFATRGTWNSTAAGVMSGSSPLAEVVTRSTGIGANGFSVLSFSASSLTRSISGWLVGPRFDPAELAALYGAGTVFVGSFGSVSVVAEGRPWKYLSSVKF